MSHKEKPLLIRREDGWWIKTAGLIQGVNYMGPYDTSSEAIEVFNSSIRARAKDKP